MEIHGHCERAFAEVQHEFERNFSERAEVGAAVSVMRAGQRVVDLWAGTARPKTQEPWKEDTVVVVFSTTKGATAMCAHVLAAQGRLDLDAPVARYWPEFAQAGKQNITVAMLLCHQAGLPALRETIAPGGFYSWSGMVSALEREAPFWEPGTRHGYHAMTYGWLVGEVVRRVSGQSLGAFFRDAVAGPLGADFTIGASPGLEPRIAPGLPGPPDLTLPFYAGMQQPGSVQQLIFGNTGGYFTSKGFNSPEAHAAEIGAGGGITNGRGLATLYAPFANGGGSLVDPDTLARMGAVVSAGGVDAGLLLPTRFSLGFMKSTDNRRSRWPTDTSCLLSEAAFGHVGYGGSIGFADPAEKLSFGYTPNRLGSGIFLDARGQALVDATYRSLGFRSNASGAWTR